MQALILAAGQGKRMNSTLPKALLTIGGVSLIARQIKQLRALSIEQITVVLGYKADDVRNHIKTPNVKFCLNENYQHTDNLFSFHLGVKDFADDCLMLHCDLIAENDLIKTVFNSPGDMVLPLDKSSISKESMKIMIENGIIKHIQKDLPLISAAGESVPLMKFSRFALKALKKEMKAFTSYYNQTIYLENAIMNTIRNGAVEPVILDITGYKWAEIDTPEDYVSAKVIFE